MHLPRLAVTMSQGLQQPVRCVLLGADGANGADQGDHDADGVVHHRRLKPIARDAQAGLQSVERRDDEADHNERRELGGVVGTAGADKAADQVEQAEDAHDDASGIGNGLAGRSTVNLDVGPGDKHVDAHTDRQKAQ